MNKLKVGFVGWRGMVGSVLMQRMLEENDFKNYASFFFSTSQAGDKCPFDFAESEYLIDANNLEELSNMDVILTCQGSQFTIDVYDKLINQNWDGHWIDAASHLRMEKNAVIVLDPINSDLIDKSYSEGVKTWVGGNCTVSLMLLAIHGLIKENLVEWVSSMTYQAASGAGANNMRELLSQMGYLFNSVSDMLENRQGSILDIDHKISNAMLDKNMPINNFGVPLAGSVIPWIDSDLKNGSSKEEWKGQNETLKILESQYAPVKVDGLCVRIGTMRCHSQALTIKMKENLSIEQINEKISAGNQWVKLITNERDATINHLSPTNASGKLDILVGRIKKLNLDSNMISLFTIGDQLLWGAAEPLRRILSIISNK